jgi:hypothetical protein
MAQEASAETALFLMKSRRFIAPFPGAKIRLLLASPPDAVGFHRFGGAPYHPSCSVRHSPANLGFVLS